jgi:uncharacterized membrane protein YcfT
VDVSKAPEKRSREYWMDLLRGFSILLVIPALPSQTMHIIGAFDRTAMGRVLRGRRKLQ